MNAAKKKWALGLSLFVATIAVLLFFVEFRTHEYADGGKSVTDSLNMYGMPLHRKIVGPDDESILCGDMSLSGSPTGIWSWSYKELDSHLSTRSLFYHKGQEIGRYNWMERQAESEWQWLELSILGNLLLLGATAYFGFKALRLKIGSNEMLWKFLLGSRKKKLALGLCMLALLQIPLAFAGVWTTEYAKGGAYYIDSLNIYGACVHRKIYKDAWDSSESGMIWPFLDARWGLWKKKFKWREKDVSLRYLKDAYYCGSKEMNPINWMEWMYNIYEFFLKISLGLNLAFAVSGSLAFICWRRLRRIG